MYFKAWGIVDSTRGSGIQHLTGSFFPFVGVGGDANVCGYLTLTWTETLLLAAAVATLVIVKSFILVALIQQGQRRDGWRRIIPLLAFFLA